MNLVLAWVNVVEFYFSDSRIMLSPDTKKTYRLFLLLSVLFFCSKNIILKRSTWQVCVRCAMRNLLKRKMEILFFTFLKPKKFTVTIQTKNARSAWHIQFFFRRSLHHVKLPHLIFVWDAAKSYYLIVKNSHEEMNNLDQT